MFRPSTREGKEARRRVDSSYSSDKHRRGAFRWTLRRLLLFCLVGTLASLAWISRSGGALVAEELHVVAMLRIPAGSLTKKEFFDQYGNQTVIIEGGLRHHPATKLGLEGLREICAGSSIETFVYDPTSNLWGGHVDEKVMPFEEYIDKYVLNETNTERRYFPGGDPGIPILCPALELFAPIPNYVSIGMQELNHSGKGESSKGRFHPLVGHQPELFVGPGGTKTEMHMDNNPSPFWMSVYFGKKMFRTISYEDSVKHMPYYIAGESIRFSKTLHNQKTGKYEKKYLEIWNPDLEAFPELKKVTVWEGTVNAGDWIYLPPATLHGVYNPEPFWGLTSMEIYPAAFDRLVDVCVDTNFMGRCEDVLLEAGGKQCNPKQFSQREALKVCIKETPYAHFIQKEYKERKDGDRYVHELAGYDSFRPWCEAICEANKKYGDICGACKTSARQV